MSVAHSLTVITRLTLYIKGKFDRKIMSPFSSECSARVSDSSPSVYYLHGVENAAEFGKHDGYEHLTQQG